MRPSSSGEASTIAAAASGENATNSSPTWTATVAEALGARRVGVADGAVAALDGGDDAGGALCGLAALERPHAVGLVRPHLGGGLGQVVGEVLGRARVVGAVHRRDGEVGQRRRPR